MLDNGWRSRADTDDNHGSHGDDDDDDDDGGGGDDNDVDDDDDDDDALFPAKFPCNLAVVTKQAFKTVSM